MSDARTTRTPAIPNVPRGVGKEMERFLSAVKECAEVAAGRRGDTTDRAVTHREIAALISTAVASAISAASSSSAALTTDAVLSVLDKALNEDNFTDEFNDRIGTLLNDAGNLQDTIQGNLEAFADLAGAADQLPYFTGVDALALTTLTAFIRTFLDDADQNTARTTLGVGTGDSPQFAGLTIEANNATQGVRITQTGTGNALLVEDSANPDSTPFVVDAAGIVLVGDTVKRKANHFTDSMPLQISCAGAYGAQIAAFSNDASGAALILSKSRGATPGANTIVQSGDAVGAIHWCSADGVTANWPRLASIHCYVDGTPGVNDMPGRLVFSTANDGFAFTTERMRITSAGAILVGVTSKHSGADHSLLDLVTGNGNAICIANGEADLTSKQASIVFRTYTNANNVATALFVQATAADNNVRIGGGQGGAPYSATNIQFYTAANNTTASGTERLRIDGSGVVTVTGTEIINANTATAALRVSQAGTGDALVIEDQANPDSTPFVVDAAGKVIVGHTAALAPASVAAPLQVHGSGGQSTCSQILASWINNTASTARLLFAKSLSGTVGTQGVVSNSTLLGTVEFLGDDGAAFQQAAVIAAYVDGTPGASDMPGMLVISTTPDGSATPLERVRITNAGHVQVRNGTLGYGAGGGAVTQATSKSTGVTINKVCGQITMHNAALAAATAVSFTVTNSTVAATDTVIGNISSGATAGAYTIQVDAVAAGSFQISLRNHTAGSLSEAVVINFSILKAVNA